jgi:pimeloyl-ACP methyl ester carboxylesterase
MTSLMTMLGAAAVCMVIGAAGSARAAGIEDRVTHGYADSNGVMIHGFPDYWYTWRHQMEGLADHFQVVAIDQRGYNLSDKPAGVENYDVRLLVGDVIAVIRSLGQQKAIIVGHDWGGAVAWQLAINVPDVVEKLIILNLPHPRGLARELAHNPEQQKNSAYARGFQVEGAEKALTAEGLASWVKDPEARPKYIEAFRRSDFGAMLNYYKRNYPREPYAEDTSPVRKVQCPVLEIHGLQDTALLAPAMNGTWDFVERDMTIMTVPAAGHFVQADEPELVTRTMRAWLLR